MGNNYLFVFLAQKKHFLKLCIWSIRSLQKFGNFNILVIVDSLEEKLFLKKYIEGVQIEVIKVDIGELNMWCWKPLLLKNLKINHEQIIVSDVDILWHYNPKELLHRVGSKPWFHKITSLDPKEIFENINNSHIPKRRIGLINMVNFLKVNGINNLPNFHVNVGLFSVSKKHFKEIAKEWFNSIKLMKTKNIMTEALISIVLANKGINPYCDIEDIKLHHKIKHRNTPFKVIEYKILEKENKNQKNGYQYATHYHGDQRLRMAVKARSLGIDKDNFFISIVAFILLDRLKKIFKKLLYA